MSQCSRHQCTAPRQRARTQEPLPLFPRYTAFSTTAAPRQHMLTSRTRAATVLKHPGAFAIRVLKSFRANQGYLLAGAVAYNTLLSILPLLILILVVLANFVDETALLTTLDRYLDLVVPGQSEAIMGELAPFREH